MLLSRWLLLFSRNSRIGLGHGSANLPVRSRGSYANLVLARLIVWMKAPDGGIPLLVGGHGDVLLIVLEITAGTRARQGKSDRYSFPWVAELFFNPDCKISLGGLVDRINGALPFDQQNLHILGGAGEYA